MIIQILKKDLFDFQEGLKDNQTAGKFFPYCRAFRDKYGLNDKVTLDIVNDRLDTKAVIEFVDFVTEIR